MKIDELTPAPDVIDAFERLAGLPYRLLLDSARDPQRLGRYSFVAADPAIVVRSRGRQTEILDLVSGAVRAHDGDALDAVRSLLPERRQPVPGLPPFQGGAAGYLGYDWGAVLERLPSPRYDDLGIPDVVLGLYDWVLAWDHEAGRSWLISTGMLGRDSDARARLVQTLLSTRPVVDKQNPIPAGAAERAPSYPVAEGVAPASVELRSSFTRPAYLAAVQRVRDYIFAGDIFQANLSQRLEAPLAEPPWTLYRRLRALNPAPFAAYIEFDDVTVLSASPERFLKVAPDGAVETRPIKGTSPRGVGPEHDAALGLALTESAKDRAENLMIVDLLRNDLSRVCAPGSVRVPELFTLENYATVHHLVSTVVGQLGAGRDAIDLIRASFPGGSITGAPKVRAMEIIAELEPSRRGVYCGSIGYLSLSGAVDLSIVIRTYLVSRVGGPRVYFSVGGGIVADSDPDAEYRETLDKARALIAALVRP
jgi:para-aminobenzoate synthetase component I